MNIVITKAQPDSESLFRSRTQARHEIDTSPTQSKLIKPDDL